MAQLSWTHHPGHRRRRRRAVRRASAGDPERARNHQRRQPPGARSRAASWRIDRAHHRDGHLRRSGARSGSHRHRRSRFRFRSATGLLGRIINVDRRSGRRGRSGEDRSHARDPPGSAGLHRTIDGSGNSRHRHQGRRPARAVRQGRQDRPVRRRRRRQDRADHGTDQQRREGARRLLGVRRRRRAHA